MAKSKFYPPVVAVLGHVDHGKTTLLDAIRKTNVAQREHGGITQSIGAYQVGIHHEGKRRKITFIDTPGHEAFLKMRSRGVSSSDIALLVVATDDGVMPQTVESIKHIKNAQIPFIVVLTKSDLEGASPQKVKQQLVKAEVALEGLGGDVPAVLVSAKTGTGVKELLELILLVSEVSGIEKDEVAQFLGVVIESMLDPRVGSLATVIVKSGKVCVGDVVVCEGIEAKVRSLIFFDGKRLQEAMPGDPIEMLGFSTVPPVGATVSSSQGLREIGLKEHSLVQKPQAQLKEGGFPLILKAGTEGSLEAIVSSLPPNMTIIEKGTGSITEGDILLAKSTKAITVGFNAKVSPSVVKLAQTEGVIIKTYTLIYELLQELLEVAKDLESGKAPSSKKLGGRAEIIASFPYKDGKILGVRVIEGTLRRGATVELEKDGSVLGSSTTASIRQGKRDVASVKKGQECGVLLTPSLDFTLGDMLLSYS